MAWMNPQCCVPGTLAAGLSRILSSTRNFHQWQQAPIKKACWAGPTPGSTLRVEDVGAPKDCSGDCL